MDTSSIPLVIILNGTDMMMEGTTPEQSERLIRAGLDKNTADMCYLKAKNNVNLLLPYYGGDTTIPIWSMSCLWNILYTAGVHYYEYQTGDSVTKVIESLVEAVERLYKSGGMKDGQEA